jgi:hypothetical protein
MSFICMNQKMIQTCQFHQSFVCCLPVDLEMAWFVFCMVITSAVERVHFISARMLYIPLRGCWCDIIVLNLHAPTEDKGDDAKDAP